MGSRFDDFGFGELLDGINRRFGISLAWYHTGGGCMVWEAKLPSGAFLWISDYDAKIKPRHDREEKEANGISLGWALFVHPPDPGDPGEPDLNRALGSVVHRTATAVELPDLVGRVLEAQEVHRHHDIDDRGVEIVTHGIRLF